ncbi:MAG: GntR family transcriptional regulator [Clostridia bacterium]|nr:GntR family transcriptional regulator [Clostridia bacterium]
MGLFLVYEQIINYYKEKISNGELVAGDELEAENVIAELFEVSRGTVRKALRYLKENGIISTERGKKSRVTENARELLTGLDISLTHKRICLMFINDGSYLKPIIDVLKERIHLMGWSCDVMFNTDAPTEKKCIDAIIEHRYDGVICTPFREMGNFEARNYFRLQKENIPFVFIGKSNEKLFCDAVFNDDYMGSYRITEELIKFKCASIIHVTDKKMDKMVALDRKNGYLDATLFFKKEQTVLDCNEGRFNSQLADILLKNKSVKLGFNVYSDIQAKRLISVLEEHELKVNADFKIICFRELYNEKVDPRFTTVAVSRNEIGYSALKIIKDRFEGEGNSSAVTHVLFNVKVREEK